MIIHNEFNIKDIVYLSTDSEQKERMITGILVIPNDAIVYRVVHEETETFNYGFELSLEKDIVKYLDNDFDK